MRIDSIDTPPSASTALPALPVQGAEDARIEYDQSPCGFQLSGVGWAMPHRNSGRLWSQARRLALPLFSCFFFGAIDVHVL
jgi:hypothetical protein